MDNSGKFNKSLDSYLESMGGYLKKSSVDEQEEKIHYNKSVKLGSKQWLPIYGVFQVLYDSQKGKPNIADENTPMTKMFCWIAYQSFWATPIIYYLTKKL